MKYKNMLGFLFIFFALGCTREAVPKPDLIQLVKQSFVDPRFKSRVGIYDIRAGRFYLFFDGHVKDSLWLEGNLFMLNEKIPKIDSTKVMILRLDSVNRIERNLKVQHFYYPSMTTKIESAFKFVFEHEKWVLKESGVAISDGHFVFPKIDQPAQLSRSRLR